MVVNDSVITELLESLTEGKYIVIKDKKGEMITSFFKKRGNVYRYGDCITSPKLYSFENPLESEMFTDVDFNNATIEVHDEQSFVLVVKDTIRRFLIKSFSMMSYNLVDIVRKVNQDRWKFVTFGGTEIGVLMCATSTDEDYYYCYIGKDLRLHFSSCVGGYNIVDTNELPLEYSMLKVMLDKDKKTLVDKVVDFTEKNVDVVITDLSY